MKKLFLFILPILLFAGLIYVFREKLTQKSILGISSQVSPAPTQVQTKDVSLDYREKKINVSWFEANSAKTFLIPNFKDKLTSTEAKDKYKCKNLVNAGFYSKCDEPIGLFVNDDGIISKFQKNSLLNGVLSINFNQIPRITDVEPRDILRVGLQAGPLLKENVSYKVLSMMRDEDARRIVAFTTGENKLYFAVFYDSDSHFSGPLLADLPDLVRQFEEKAQIQIADAINLDGGSASSFHTGDLSLSEITFSGSFFCVEPSTN